MILRFRTAVVSSLGEAWHFSARTLLPPGRRMSAFIVRTKWYASIRHVVNHFPQLDLLLHFRVV